MKCSLWIGVMLVSAMSLVAQSPTTSVFSAAGGVDGTLYAVQIQTDGCIVIGGQFSSVNGVPRQNIARLKPDGTLDSTFLAGEAAGVNGTVYALLIQPDGGIVVGGLFSVAAEKTRMNLARFAADGTLDSGLGARVAPNGKVLALARTPSGDLILGGEFSEVGNQPRKNLAILAADGTLKSAFAGTINGTIQKLALTPTASVIAVGEFPSSATRGANIATQNQP